MSLTVLWFIVFLVLLFIEIVSINLLTLWFVIGSLASFCISFFIDSIVIQSIVFVVVSILSLVLMKPFVSKFKNFKITPTNSDRVIGKVGDVIKDIGSNNYGEVKVFGSVWTACSENGEEIKVGDKVKILGIEGVKLIVKKEEN